MSRRLTLLAIAAVALAAAPTAAAAPPSRTLAVSADRLAMDGPIVGASVPGTPCEIIAWNVLSGRHTRIGSCQVEETSTGSGLVELAVAGQRVAWVENGGGNLEQFET